MAINEHWYVWLMEQQRRNNLIIALATFIIAMVGILQIIKIYEFFTPDWVFIVLGGLIALCLIIIIGTILEKQN